MLQGSDANQNALHVLRAFIYKRVSTDDQENNTSLEQQELDCRAYAMDNNMIVIDSFEDIYSGAYYRERKGLTEMRERYRRGEADVIIVRTFDRLSREPAHYYILSGEMKEYQINLHCVKEKQDDTVFGQLIQTVLMSFAKLEREKIVERTSSGRRARVTQKNQYMASGKAPYGYNFDDPVEKSKLVINEAEAEVVRKILRLRAEGGTINNITRQLIASGIPTASGKEGSYWDRKQVRRIIERGRDLYRGIAYAFKTKSYKGYRQGKLVEIQEQRPQEEWILLPEGTVPRIIDDVTAFKALEVAEINKQDSPRNNNNPEDALLRAGFIRCGACGGRMVYQRQKHKRARGNSIECVYHCCQSMEAARKCKTNMLIHAPKIDRIVWEYVSDVIKNLSTIEHAVETLLEQDFLGSTEKAALTSIEDCKALIHQYREDMRHPRLNAATRAIILEDLGRQTDLLANLEKEVAFIKAGRVNYNLIKDEYLAFASWCQEFRDSIDMEVTYAQKREALRKLGVTAFIYKERDGRYEIRLAPPKLMQMISGIRPTGAAKNDDIAGTNFQI